MKTTTTLSEKIQANSVYDTKPREAFMKEHCKVEAISAQLARHVFSSSPQRVFTWIEENYTPKTK